MKQVVNEMVSHLKAVDNIADHNIDADTIKPYQGELLEAKKIAKDPPAVYVMMNTGSPYGRNKSYDIRLITVSKSHLYNQQDQSNLELADQVGEYLEDYFMFPIDSPNYSFDPDQIEAETMASDNKYNIIELRLDIEQGRE